MANKNTWNRRRLGLDGYGEKRGVRIDTSKANPERKSAKKIFKVRQVELIITDKDELISVQKIKKGKANKS
jgi:hypothetical protein